MKVLVTGATGFLGRAVVRSFLARGHAVRALVRPATDLSRADWPSHVEIARADLRVHHPTDALHGVDAVVHLAASLSGSDEDQFASTVVGTERLLQGMVEAGTGRIVLASSLSVYDWSALQGRADETSPVESEVYDRDGYAIAKLWQERVVRVASERHGWELTVLRPGFIWGPGHTDLPGIGQPLGPLHLVVGYRRRLPLTYVDNCADAFVLAATDRRAIGRTYNVIDGSGVPVARFLRARRQASGEDARHVHVPYGLGLGVARAAARTSRALFGPGGKLPSILVPARFEARFKPVEFDGGLLERELGWRPAVGFAAAARAAFAPAAQR